MVKNEKVERLGGSTIDWDVIRKRQRIEDNKRTGLLTVTRVLLEGVESVRVAMKLPSAKFASDAGRTK